MGMPYLPELAADDEFFYHSKDGDVSDRALDVNVVL